MFDFVYRSGVSANPSGFIGPFRLLVLSDLMFGCHSPVFVCTTVILKGRLWTEKETSCRQLLCHVFASRIAGKNFPSLSRAVPLGSRLCKRTRDWCAVITCRPWQPNIRSDSTKSLKGPIKPDVFAETSERQVTNQSPFGSWTFSSIGNAFCFMAFRKPATF
jgi:hypothetical protein